MCGCQGEVHNTTAISRYQLPPPFVPYFYAGGPERGVAVFDQEGGWALNDFDGALRRAAAAHGLQCYVRRGPLFTTFDYVLSKRRLDDDVSSDPLQRTARLADACVVAVPAIDAALRHLPPQDLAIAARGERALLVALVLRLVLPLLDVLTIDDLRAKFKVDPA